MKHIVIDSRHLDTSTGVYMQNLIQQLNELNEDSFRFTVLVPTKDVNHWKMKLPYCGVMGTDEKWYSLAEQFSFAMKLYRLKPDLVHFCMPQQPLLYFGKRVTTIHDLTLVRFDNIDMNPLLYKLRKLVFSALLKNVIWRSDAIVVPTNYTKQDIIDYTSQKYSKKITVTPEAGDPLAAADEPIKKLEGKQFMFFVGNAFPYKNLFRIVDAHKELKKKYPDLHLVFAGKKDYFYEQIEQYVKDKSIHDIHILGFISEGEKRWLFQNAVAYVVASLSEGFHIPGLEAMYEGCPVVSSTATCLPEVYETAALYFDPNSTKELVSQLENLLQNKKLSKQMSEKGSVQVKKYSWKRMAQQTLAVYKTVLRQD